MPAPSSSQNVPPTRSVHFSRPAPVRDEPCQHALGPDANPVRNEAPRLEGLDALRAAASLGVIALHAAVAYMLYPLPDLLWAAQDQGSPLADAVGWAIQCCAMPVFFVMSGFLSAGVLEQRAPGRFVLNRLRRVGAPLAALGPVILPMTCYVWVAGWIAAGRYPLLKLRSMKFEPEVEANLWGLAHLWYLEYLLVDCLVLAGAAWLVSRLMRHADFAEVAARWRTALTRHVRWLPLALVVPATAILWSDMEIVVGFQHSLLPIWSKLTYYALFFAAGVLARQASPDGRPLATSSPVAIVLAGLLFCATLPLIHLHLEHKLSDGQQVLLAGMLTSYGWMVAWGSFRMALAWKGSLSRPIRYVADASYWIYLIHLPIVGLAQVTAGGTSFPSEVKFAGVTLVSWSLSLLTYQAFVRGRWLGRLLEGAPKPAESRPFLLSIYRGDEDAPPEPAPRPTPRTNRPRRAA